MQGEEHAISMYKGLINFAKELKEYGIRRILEDILLQEEEHRRDILSLFGR